MIAVSSTPASISHYRKLLVSEWDESFPAEVLSLLWKAVKIPPSHAKRAELSQLLDPGQTTQFPERAFQDAVKKIGEAKDFIRLPKLPKLPDHYNCPEGMPKNLWPAIRLASYLALPAHTTIEGDLDYFVDVQALAFQAAIHFVLPEVKKSHSAEYAILLHAATLFAVSYSTYDPSHYAYMISMIYHYLDDEELRLRTLYSSFRFTSPSDHSFLTKAQEYWSELLDRKRYDEAEEFLFSLHWWSLPSQKDEVREMFTDAMAHTRKNSKKKRRA